MNTCALLMSMKEASSPALISIGLD